LRRAWSRWKWWIVTVAAPVLVLFLLWLAARVSDVPRFVYGPF
jgi:hypothetical protein